MTTNAPASAGTDESKPGPARAAAGRRSPYQGLVPYTEADAEYFFGRDSWREIIVDNVVAYRLTLLYGASGVGKSSVLSAGVARHLREKARLNLAERGKPGLAVVENAAWKDDPAAGLAESVRSSIEMLAPELAREPPAGQLADVLEAWSDRVGGPLLIVLDQFEEYFLYHADDSGEGSFAEEFAKALRRHALLANFVISIREDAVAKLDRFEGRIPGLMDNLLRIEHLDREAAREAIVRPIEQWNRSEREGQAEITIEPTLVEAVLHQVEAGKVAVGGLGEGAVAPEDAEGRDGRIEAPYLQIVLSRIWDEEKRAGSRELRLETLERLGGAERIVRTHLDATMEELSRSEQRVAARIFRYLVTPSGAKIAHAAEDLADYVELPPSRLTHVIERLSRGDVRILAPTGRESYEIYHDALAGPILDWRTRFIEQGKRRRRLLAGALVALLALGLGAVLAFLAIDRRSGAAESLRSREALIVEPLTALEHGGVVSAAFSPDGRRVVTASDDGTVGIFEAATGRHVTSLRGHKGTVWSAAFSSDGRQIVTASDDRTARVWDARTGRQLGLLQAHGAPVTTASFSSDGRLIVTGSADGIARVWDARTGGSVTVIRERGGVKSAAFSPNGKLLLTTTSAGLASVWEARSGNPIALYGFAANSAAFSPDGKRVVTANDDKMARIMEATSSEQVAVFTGHEGTVNSAAYSPDGRRVVTASDDGTARIWGPRVDDFIVLRGHKLDVVSAAFSRDGKLILTADDVEVGIWDARTGVLQAVIAGGGGTLSVAEPVFSPDSKRVLTVGGHVSQSPDDLWPRVWPIAP